jgi:hypothetical protein
MMSKKMPNVKYPPRVFRDIPKISPDGKYLSAKKKMKMSTMKNTVIRP